MDELAVDAGGLVGAVGVVQHPPLVAVAVARPKGHATHLELLSVAALGGVVDHGLVKNLLVVEAAAQAQHLAKPRQVACRGVEACALQRRAHAVHHHMGVFLGAQLLPDVVAHELGPVFAGSARHDPAQHLRMHGAVHKTGAMFAFLLERLEEVVHIGRPLVARRTGQQTAGPAVAKDLGGRVGVDLAEAHGARHVHHIAHLHVAPGRFGQLGYVFGHQRLGVDLALVRQLRRHEPGERLGDREQQMRRVGLHLVVVALVHHAALVHHHQRIGVGAGEPLVHRDGLALVVIECHCAQWSRVGRQRRWCRRAPADIARGLQLAQVLHGPAQLRVFVRVAQVHTLRPFGWEGAHVA